MSLPVSGIVEELIVCRQMLQHVLVIRSRSRREILMREVGSGECAIHGDSFIRPEHFSAAASPAAHCLHHDERPRIHHATLMLRRYHPCQPWPSNDASIVAESVIMTLLCLLLIDGLEILHVVAHR